MALSDKKLYCGDRGNGQIIDTVNLYTDLKDVQNQGKVFNFNGQNLYAKYGELADSKASKLHIKVNGVEKALLRTARTVWNFDNVHIFDKSGTASASGKSATLVGKYSNRDGYIDAELQWEVTIPTNAKNIVAKWDWETHNKPVVFMDWFNKNLNLDGSSSVTSGHVEVNLVAGAYWSNKATAGSYSGGISSKYITIKNFSIEFDTD